jgi:hypothetical protein
MKQSETKVFTMGIGAISISEHSYKPDVKYPSITIVKPSIMMCGEDHDIPANSMYISALEAKDLYAALKSYFEGEI